MVCAILDVFMVISSASIPGGPHGSDVEFFGLTEDRLRPQQTKMFER